MSSLFSKEIKNKIKSVLIKHGMLNTRECRTEISQIVITPTLQVKCDEENNSPDILNQKEIRIDLIERDKFIGESVILPLGVLERTLEFLDRK